MRAAMFFVYAQRPTFRGDFYPYFSPHFDYFPYFFSNFLTYKHLAIQPFNLAKKWVTLHQRSGSKLKATDDAPTDAPNNTIFIIKSYGK